MGVQKLNNVHRVIELIAAEQVCTPKWLNFGPHGSSSWHNASSLRADILEYIKFTMLSLVLASMGIATNPSKNIQWEFEHKDLDLV